MDGAEKFLPIHNWANCPLVFFAFLINILIFVLAIDKLCCSFVWIPATREHRQFFLSVFKSIDLEFFQALPGSGMIRNGGLILPQAPPLPRSWGRWELVPFYKVESGRRMSPSPGQCSNSCITREKHFMEHSSCSSKSKLTASTLWISQIFQCIFVTLWKYRSLETLWAFTGHLSWKNRDSQLLVLVP